MDFRNESALAIGAKYGIVPREYTKHEARIRAFINFWQPTYFYPTFIQYGFRFQHWSLKHNLISILFYGIFLPFYFIGFILLFKQKRFLLLLIATIPLIHSLIHAYMIWPLERYRSPVTFIIVMIGIMTMLFLTEKLKIVLKRNFV